MNTFDPSTHIQKIVIVGCGGTGAQVARSVARIIYDMKQLRMHAPKMTLIDPDVIEPQNVGRQMFTDGDIGQSKALVLMRRFNMALGLDITAIDQPFNANRHAERWGTVIIGAVDNHLARLELSKLDGAVWIDAGNHANSGQVIIGNTGSHTDMMQRINGRDGKYSYLPNAGLLFPALLEPEAPKPEPAPDASCADLVATREQDLLVNDWLAVATSQYVYKLLHRQPINSFITYIDADGMNVRSVPINKENLMPYLQLEEEKAG